MRILAVVPARAGSKRLPEKNIRQMFGKPLIQWTLEAALSIDEITRVIVTTDSQRIAEIAKECEAQVPFIRPASLAKDTTSSVDVIRHVLDYYKEQGEEFDFVLLLQPTSPTRKPSDISGAIEHLKRSDADAVVSVCRCEHSPLWANTLPEDYSMNGFIRPKIAQTRSQDLPEYFRINGAIYLFNTRRFAQENTLFFSSNIFAYVMDQESSIDIDHEIDFLTAEAVLKSRSAHV